MNSLQFEKSQFKYFCVIIGFKPKKIEKIFKDIDWYYNEWLEKKPDKVNGGFKKYQDGTEKTRPIRPSLRELKIVQNSIKNRILAPIKLPEHIHGGVKRRSNITNAKPHQGNKYQFTTDLHSFYPSITHERINETFLSLGFTNHFSRWLTKLTSWKFQLPQGTPTSTHIANFVFLKTDYQLVDFCNKHDIEYTRYVDDLTFSSPKCFKHLLNEILEIIISNNFKISYRKTKYEGNQNITGVDVHNNCIDGPERIRREAQKETSNNYGYQPYTN
jgi:RNA-directed DNA polymerase